MKIDITTRDRLTTLQRNPPLPSFFTNRSLTRRQRLRRWVRQFTLKPTMRQHHTDAGGGGDSYRLKDTRQISWLGLDLLMTRRYPITTEQRASWASQSHLTSSRSLSHF